MVHDSKVVSFTGWKPVGRVTLPPALVRLRDASGQTLKAVMADVFDRADDTLFELADRAASNLDQTAYFDAMRELRLRRSAMAVSVLQYVSRAFNDMGRFNPRPNAGDLERIDQDSLTLVDHAELEQQVAIDGLIAKLRNRHAQAIRLLTARVNHLVPSLELADSQMPLSPEIICGGIAEACGDLDIDIRAKLVVLKLFDRLLVDRLGEFYQDANRTLIAEGILPDMKRPPIPVVTRAMSGTDGGSGNGGDDLTGASGSDAGAPPTFSELTALLRQGGEARGVMAGAANGAGTLDTSGLLERMSQAQHRVNDWAPNQVVPLGEQLQSALRNPEGQVFQVAQMDSDVINLVSMLFDFILEDRQLHPVMKALIGRLQIPVLKVALADRNFFNRGGHPVRKLLNELASAAIGWTEKAPGQRDPLRDKIQAVVNRVLGEFTDDVALFDELLKDFSHFMDLDRRRRELVEQRLRDAEEGRARQERAAQTAREWLTECCQGREIPEPVKALLNEAWNRYLQWILLREGDDSESWRNARALTERVVWSVDPQPVTEDTRSELLRAIPTIVDELRRALQDISWDPFATDAAIRDLELAHVDVFQRLVTATPVAPDPEPPAEFPDRPPERTPPETAEAPVAAPVESGEPSVEVGKGLETAEDAVQAGVGEAVAEAPESSADRAPQVGPEWLERADALRVGSWIELVRADSKARCKLAAFIKATGKYIFVNRSGAKVAEYHREELASAMATGEITLLDDGLIFDRALESIIDNLRNSRRD